MLPDLILIANAAEARVFTRASPTDPLVPLTAMAHPEGRLKASALGDAKPGHGSADSRPGGVAFSPRTDARRHEDLLFAQHVAAQVEQALAHGRYGQLHVLAGSPFLGELKAALGHAGQRALGAAVDLDLTHFGPSELEDRVNRALATAQGSRAPE